MPETLEISLLPKQADFVESDAKTVLYSGAFGAGKSRAACYRAMVRAMRSEAARVGLCRKTLTALKMTTLRTLLEPDGDLGPVLPEGAYEYKKTPGEERIKLLGGGEIIPFGCDDHLKVGSLQLSDCVIDEALEVVLEEWNMLLGRIRVSFELPDGTKHRPSLAAVCNPGSPGHFLYKLFIEDPTPDSQVIKTSTLENPHLPKDYIKTMLQTYVGPALRRYVYGEWCVQEGACYPMFDPAVHCIRMRPNFTRYVGGVDYGYRNPMVLRVHGVWAGDHSHVVSESYEKEMLTMDFTALCVEAARHYSPMTFVVDPSAAGLIAEMRLSGLHVVKANNDVLAGIAAVQNALRVPGENIVPRLTMDPGCAIGNMEYLSYRWKDNDAKDEPVKVDDHAPDADRYARMHIDKRAGGRRLAVGESYQGRRLTVAGEKKDPIWDDRLWTRTG
jgi:PBSX family phage terminase large subunit